LLNTIKNTSKSVNNSTRRIACKNIKPQQKHTTTKQPSGEKELTKK